MAGPVELSPMQQRLAEQFEKNRAVKAAKEAAAGESIGCRFITYLPDGSEVEFATLQQQLDHWMHRFDGAETTYQYPGPEVPAVREKPADPRKESGPLDRVPEEAWRAMEHYFETHDSQEEHADVGSQQEAQ